MPTHEGFMVSVNFKCKYTVLIIALASIFDVWNFCWFYYVEILEPEEKN